MKTISVEEAEEIISRKLGTDKESSVEIVSKMDGNRDGRIATGDLREIVKMEDEK